MSPQPKQKPINTWLKYSGLAFQMFFLLLFAWFIGGWIDHKMALTKPVFALSLMVLFLVGFFIKLIKDTSNEHK